MTPGLDTLREYLVALGVSWGASITWPVAQALAELDDPTDAVALLLVVGREAPRRIASVLLPFALAYPCPPQEQVELSLFRTDEPEGAQLLEAAAWALAAANTLMDTAREADSDRVLGFESAISTLLDAEARATRGKMGVVANTTAGREAIAASHHVMALRLVRALQRLSAWEGIERTLRAVAGERDCPAELAQHVDEVLAAAARSEAQQAGKGDA